LSSESGIFGYWIYQDEVEMPKGQSSKVVFKRYVQNQPQFLPPSLDELIPAGHAVRVVNAAVDRMPLDALLATYEGGGASRYHPKLLLKVFLYGYLEGTYSSRRLAKALRENVHYMWLSGSQRPDFRTLNSFRSSRLKRTIDEVFVSLVELLAEAGLVTLNESFVDGTKLEAQANRYTFVWGKATRKHQAKLETKVRALLRQIDAENDVENARYGDRDLEEVGEDAAPITAEQLERKVREMEERLKQPPVDASPAATRPLKKAVKQIRKDYLPRLTKYEQQQEILGGRNSYSKTDPDATFMRMKEDHMRNGQLKPGYNVQISTEQQFITNVTVHQNRTDTATLPEHLDHFQALHGRDPEVVVADAGYGSEENYHELEARGCTAYVKYSTFDEEQRKRRKKKLSTDDFVYDIERDTYTCPAGRTLRHRQTRWRRTDNGYRSLEQIYEAEECTECPLKERCCPKYERRRLYVRPLLERYREARKA
jgi:transposase